jgi:hypothetical protein
MASHRLPRILGCCCVLGALALFGAAAAEGEVPQAADTAVEKPPKITGIKILALTTTGTLAPCPDMKASRQSGHRHTKAAAAPSKPCVEAVASPGTTASFRLAILGENLAPAGAPPPAVTLDTDDPGHPVTNQVVAPVDATRFDVSGGVPVPATIKAKVSIGGKPIPLPPGLTVSISATPTKALKEFQVKLEPQTNKEFPNLHSLLVTRQGGDGAGFADKASLMQVDLEPTGATDLTIVQTNQQQMELHYVAADDYVPKNVVVTVFDGSDIENRHAIAVAKPASPPEDPNAPKITDVEVDFVNRAYGKGRIHIYGKGFGKVPRPGYPVDDYLCDCLEASSRNDYHRCNVHHDPAPAPPTDNLVKDAQPINCPAYDPAWERFQQGLRGNVTVGVNSRDPEIRVEKTKIIDMNDDMIDVYFEFTRYPGYAWPFRLSGVDLTVTKDVKKTDQAVKSDGISAEVARRGPATFMTAQAIGPKPDANLTYQYSVLDYDGARSQLGSIVADNFYVVQLAVVNTGKKKVAVPLAAIQAEVEWLHVDGGKKWYFVHGLGGQEVQEFFMEGPPTLPPIPLAGVAGYFGIYQSESARRVKVFNVLNGITAFVTALLPIAGPALKDAEVVFSGGFIPGLGKAWPDVAAQQLQHLTSLSWQDTETVAANGGSVSKYIYIQRTQQFGDMPEPRPSTPSTSAVPSQLPRRTMKQVSNILDIEVTGYEVPDTPAKKAAKSPAKQTTPNAPADPSETPGATQGSDASAPPATPPDGTASSPPSGQ